MVFILLNYNGNSLFNDEISYAQNSYKLVTGISIYLYKLMPVLANYEILTIYRLINFVLILAPAYLIFNYNKSNKLLISVILLVLIRFFLSFVLDGHVGSHPNMHGFISSFFTTLFGLNDFNFKLIQILPLVLLINFCIVKFKLDYFFSIVLIILISTNPFIEHFSFIIEQANYTTIFVSLIIIICYNKKVELKYISLIIGISLLFRSTLICLIFIPFIYNYYNRRKFDQIFLKNLIPLLIGLPTFLKSLLYGTPSTENIFNLGFIDIFSKVAELDILYNIYNVMDYYIIFPLLLIIILIYLKRNDILLMLLSVTISYILLHLLADAPKFASKYYYELTGCYFLLFYIFFIILILNLFKRYSKYILVSSLILFFAMSLNFKDSIKQKNIYIPFNPNISYETTFNRNFNPLLSLDNELKYLFNLMNNELDVTIIFNSSYHGDFPYILYKLSKNEFDEIYGLSESYNKKNRFSRVHVDVNVINELNNEIKYLVFTDTLDKLNNSEIKELLSSGWSIHLEKSLNKNDFGWLILKNNNFDKS